MTMELNLTQGYFISEILLSDSDNLIYNFFDMLIRVYNGVFGEAFIFIVWLVILGASWNNSEKHYVMFLTSLFGGAVMGYFMPASMGLFMYAYYGVVLAVIIVEAFMRLSK